MKISREDFFKLSLDQHLSQQQTEALWDSLEKKGGGSRGDLLSKVIYYLGALIVIAAMTWFMGLGWELFGGGGIFIISTIYALLSTFGGAYLWEKKDLRIPAGLLITIAVCMVPLAIYGLESYLDIWPEENPGPYQNFFSRVKGSWIFMEIGTIGAALIALKFFPFPFITAPLFFSLWFLVLDLSSLIFGEAITWQTQSWITLFFGLGLMIIGYCLDFYRKKDYAFWVYFFGVISFWASLGGLVWNKGEVVMLLYCSINAFLLLASVFLQRKILMVFGALGIFSYFSHLAYKVFEDSVGFPFALSFLGFGLMYVGFLYQKNAKRIEASLMEKIPLNWQKYLPY